MRLEVKRPETIVEDIVPTPGCTLVVGREKTGKTLLAVQLGMSVATGKPLFDNYRITNPGPVMFVEVDDPAGAASLRLKLLEHVGHDHSAPIRFIEKMSKLPTLYQPLGRPRAEAIAAGGVRAIEREILPTVAARMASTTVAQDNRR